MTQLTPHFTLAEACTTEHTEIRNIPSPAHMVQIQHTAECMEEVRAVLENNAIKVNNWFRSKELNIAVGGAKNSGHMAGGCVDFTCEGYGTPYEICQTLSRHKLKLKIDQLIYEGTWVHIGFVIPPRVPRLEVLTYVGKVNGKKTYVPGLVLRKGA